jgi:hypothetical protein
MATGLSAVAVVWIARVADELYCVMRMRIRFRYLNVQLSFGHNDSFSD